MFPVGPAKYSRPPAITHLPQSRPEGWLGPRAAVESGRAGEEEGKEGAGTVEF